ncbi:o-succinylbenzoate synthase [Nitriliruptoria bacterium AS10]|nr:o-succinylbenzoate synthase [Salsipaludibacter albus]
MDDLVPFRIPLRSRFRGVDHRQGVLLHGASGWGEFAPFPDYPPSITATWLAAAREAAEDGFPPAVRTQVPVNAIVPAVDPDRAAGIARHAGCRTVKVKVAEPGQDLAQDLDRLAAVRAAVGPDVALRIDANRAWDVPTAVHALARLAVHDLEYVEQPCATLGELAEVRRRSGVAVAADESIRLADDPIEAARRADVDVVIVKVAPLGGVRRALAVAEAAGVPAVVSSAVDTSIGLSAGLALAAALPELPHACGLGTGLLLAADLTDRPLVPTDGTMEVRVATPTRTLVETHQPDPATMAELLEQLRLADAALSRPS